MLGETELYAFEDEEWQRHGSDELVALMAQTAPMPPQSHNSLKRRLFPSTLWQSRIPAVQSARGLLSKMGSVSDATVVLHTTYLASLARQLKVAGARVVLDAYDLVWRAHENDGIDGPIGRRLVRRSYARWVRRSELGEVQHADALVVAGYADLASLAMTQNARWVPTPPMQVDPVPFTAASGRLRIGFLGHFHHHHTYLSAKALMNAPVAREPGVELVFAGLGSNDLTVPDRVTVIGGVRDPSRFYAAVDAVVAPVVGGSGMKVKLVEAVLAARPTITTPRGAEGFPPPLRRHLGRVEIRTLDAAAVRAHIDASDREGARRDFEEVGGFDAVITAYRQAVAAD